MKNLTDKKNLIEFTNKIGRCENFHFVKFGDGELICIDGGTGKNCDLHPYSSKLGEALLDSFIFLSNLSNCYIAEWIWGFENIRNSLLEKIKVIPNFINYDLILQQDGKLTEELFEFYKTIKLSSRRKIFIGNYKLAPSVKNFLNVDKIVVVPSINCYRKYKNILSRCKVNVTNDAVLLFSCGMVSKVLIHDLILYNSNITCIDVGSGFDPIFNKQTRSNQPSIETLKIFYKELLMHK